MRIMPGGLRGHLSSTGNWTCSEGQKGVAQERSTLQLAGRHTSCDQSLMTHSMILNEGGYVRHFKCVLGSNSGPPPSRQGILR